MCTNSTDKSSSRANISGGLTTRDKIRLQTESYKSVSDFGTSLFKHYLNINDTPNCVISPVSVFLCMSMLKHGANGETKAELEQALGHSSERAAEYAMKVLKKSSDSLFTLTSANALFLQYGFEPSFDFVSHLRKCYRANVDSVDFRSTDGVDKVNCWVEKETNGKIKRMLEPGDDMIMAVINAIYMKGSWVEQFPEGATYEDAFIVNAEKVVTVNFMRHWERDFRYHCDDEAKFSLAFFPYEKEKWFNLSWEMGVLLPETGLDPADFLKYLDYESLKELREKAVPHLLNVKLPKTKLEAKFELIPFVQRMGVSRAFTPAADFSAISNNVATKVSNFLQKCVIEIDEKGTVAAAETMLCSTLLCSQITRIWNFHVTSPFLFFIYNPESGLCLFCGCVNDPSAQ